MNSFLNIQIRVLANNARRQLGLLRQAMGGLSMKQATASTTGFGRAWNALNLGRMGSQMQWLGRQIEYNFTLPLVAAGAAATKLALDNEKAFTRITKVYGDAAHGADFYAKEIDSLGKAFVALSDHFGVAQSDALNIAADWAAAGASGLALAKSVKLTMETMILGELDAGKATKSLIAIQAQYGLSIDELAKAIEVLNMVENQTGASMADLIDGFTRAAGVAKSYGVSVEELAADIAALTPATGTAANAGNALKTIFSRLMAPTKEVNDALKYMGIQINSIAWQGANAQQKLLIMAKSFNKLTDSEKGFVSSTIATRYQVNRFEVLMAELVNQHGYYARAIESTADKTALFRQAQYELNQVLTSNPQRLKIIWTQLQNAMTNIIQPLIPLILYLADSLKNLVVKFSELNPATQKFIILAFGILAAVGPVVRYLGALQVLVFELAKGFKLLLVPLWIFRSVMGLVLAIPYGKIITPFLVGLRVLIENITLFIRVAPLLFTFMFGQLRVIFTAGFAGMQRAILAFAAWSGVAWRLITTNPIQLFRNMWSAIIAMSVRIIPTLRAVSTAVASAMTGPWGWALAAVVGLIVIFWDDIKQAFENGVNWIHKNQQAMANAFAPLGRAAEAVKNAIIKAFNALPAGVQNALLAVVRIVRTAAMKVYEFFSYINPWARHSPSLVDNVTTGVNEIIRQYGRLHTLGSTFATVKDDLDLFADATKRINRSAEANKYKEIRQDLLRLASDAVAPFDRLVVELYGLEDQLKVVGKEMKVQQAVVDSLKDSLDQANDALDSQKTILQKMKDEADNYQDVINRINGDLEVLTGTREALRTAGAGSDILGTYNDQIDALKQQKQGINDQLSAAQAAYDQQKKLVEDLTTARDALQLSYDEEYKKLQLIKDQYDKISERIHEITSAIDDFVTAVDALKSSGGAGGLGVTPANFPGVGGSGKLGREGGIADQSSAIDEFTKQLSDQTKNMFGLFDFLDPIKKSWNKAKEWLKTNVGPALSVIGDGISAVFDKLPNPFAKLDFSGFLDTFKNVKDTLIGWFGEIWKLIGPPLEQIKKIFQEELGKAFKEIGPELAKFKDLVGPLGKMFENIWTAVKPVAAFIGGVLLFAFKLIAEVIAHTLRPVLDWLIDIIKSILKILRGLIEFIVGIFTGDLDMIGKGLKDFFGGLWDAIWSTIKNVALLIWGIVEGLVKGIVDFFTWLWDELVGHSIIPDIVNGIISWFKFLWKIVQAIWEALLTALKWAWDNILYPIFKAFVNTLGWLKDTAIKVFDWMKQGWNNFVAIIEMAKIKIMIFVMEMIKKFFNLIDFLKGMKSKVGDAIKGLWDGLVDQFKRALNTLISLWNKLDFSINIKVPDWVPGVGGKGFSVKDIFPDIPLLARGGMVANQATAIVGEGRRGFPEYVIPTDPSYRRRALALFAALGVELGFGSRKTALMARGGIIGSYDSVPASGRPSNSSVVATPSSSGGDLHFYGDLVFPNITDGDDADEFIKNLRALAGER